MEDQPTPIHIEASSGATMKDNTIIVNNYHIHVHSGDQDFINKLGRMFDGLIGRKTQTIENIGEISENNLRRLPD